MRLYLAGRWSNRDDINKKSYQLQGAGHTITSRWHSDPNHLIIRGAEEQKDIQWNDSLAHHDMDDLYAADAIIYFPESGSRGGSHVEFGMALAWGKDLILVGPRSHVFTYFCQVIRYVTWEDLLEAAKTEGTVNNIKAFPPTEEIRGSDGSQDGMEH